MPGRCFHLSIIAGLQKESNENATLNKRNCGLAKAGEETGRYSSVSGVSPVLIGQQEW